MRGTLPLLLCVASFAGRGQAAQPLASLDVAAPRPDDTVPVRYQQPRPTPPALPPLPPLPSRPLPALPPAPGRAATPTPAATLPPLPRLPTTGTVTPLPALPPLDGPTSLASLPANLVPELLGDLGPRSGISLRPPVTPTVPAAVQPVVPAVAATPQQPAAQVLVTPQASTVTPRLVIVPRPRDFKIAENESPRPQDRVYFSFNYFDQYQATTNRRLGAGAGGSEVNVAREHFGVERTFLDGNASVGLRLPLTTFQADLSPGVGATGTGFGDLAVILKYAAVLDRDTGDVLSFGLAIAAPTGRERLAGLTPLTPHGVTVQPFVGVLSSLDAFYLQGFAALDVPAYSHDVTLLFTDLAAGYYLYRSNEPGRLLTGVAPTIEVHVNTPLNQRGTPSLTAPTRVADSVNLTSGVNLDLGARRRLAVGVVMPVTGPRPFDFEVLVQLRMGF